MIFFESPIFGGDQYLNIVDVCGQKDLNPCIDVNKQHKSFDHLFISMVLIIVFKVNFVELIAEQVPKIIKN